MVNWKSLRSWAVLLLCVGAVISTGCGISSEGSRYNMQNGVSDSGYPPKGSGTNTGSPAVSSMGDDVNAKGIEGEHVKAAPQNIPANVAATPRT